MDNGAYILRPMIKFTDMASHRILIVEDQREVSRLLHTSLDTLEYDLQVVEILSGEEAILDASRNKVDLLIADYRLPGITGIELMHKVRQFHPQSKVILITGLTDRKIRKEVAEAGADAFFIKPIPIADFLDGVERHLGLVKTILPPEPISPDLDEVHRNLPDLLAALRQELDAAAVFLLNDTGRVQARAGDLLDSSTEVYLLPLLLSIYNAGQKVTQLLGEKVASGWHIFNNSEEDIIFSPVGGTHAMLVIGKNLANMGQMLNTMNIFSTSRASIERELARVEAVTESIPAIMPAFKNVPEESALDMETLFKETKKKLKPQEVDAFWNKAASKHKITTRPDMLTYEQARQLGLTPKEKQ